MSGQRKHSLNGVGQKTDQPLVADKLAVSISGTFVGTWAIKRKVANKEDVVETGSGARSGVIDNGVSLPTWVECTAYTSGSIEVALES